MGCSDGRPCAGRRLLIAGDPFFDTRHQIIALAGRHRLPYSYQCREDAGAGGLLSYGISSHRCLSPGRRLHRRILKGAKTSRFAGAAGLKFELVINLKTAKALGLEFRPRCARADEVIE